MAPIPASPRVVCYHQTQFLHDGTFVSILPLITEATGATHVNVAAFHINDNPGDITLNNDPPAASKYDPLWEETEILQFSGIKVLAMIGGAAKGTFTRLDKDEATFESFYTPLRDILRKYKFDGVDLDVEEQMSLDGIIRLIDRVHTDFGSEFLITLAPVAPALTQEHNLSGFDYEALEVMRGSKISWYNTQFYCGWGNLGNPAQYQRIVAYGWPAHKIVAGAVTNPENGSGFIPLKLLADTMVFLKTVNSQFGGVMGWEYFNSLGPEEKKGEPWEWARTLAIAMGLPRGEY